LVRGDEGILTLSVRRQRPPVGWQRTVEHEPQRTTVWACEKTVVMLDSGSLERGRTMTRWTAGGGKCWSEATREYSPSSTP
jgi:hypothetical protein